MSSGPILYVEDDVDDKELTVIHFGDAGFTPPIVWRRNGQEALDYLHEALRGEAPMPVLILSDIKMPKMSGLELLEALRGNPIWSPIPFVFMSSSGNDRDRRRAEELGATLYLRKPAGRDEYRRVIDRLREVLAPA